MSLCCTGTVGEHKTHSSHTFHYCSPSSKNYSSSMNYLLFRGTKTFWKTKSSLDLAFVEYSEQGVYEIIAYDPVMRKHAPRLYIDINRVKNMVNHDVHSESCILDGTITTFLFNNLFIVEYLPESKLIRIDVRPVFYMNENHVVLSVDRPPGLSFYSSPFDERDGVEADISSHLLGRVQMLQISLRDKWRLPLILVRVSKSLPLRDSDAKIWACFVHNKTNVELVEFVATALAARIPSVSKPVLRSAAHSALLPERCPFPPSTGSCSLSGTATPLTLSNRSTPTARSRRNSFTPSLEAAVSAEFSDPVAASAQRSPVRAAGLPPLTPSTHNRASSRGAWVLEGETPESPPNLSLRSTSSSPQQSVAGSAQPTPRRRRIRVPSLENMWPVRLTRSALNSSSASLSTRSSPQLSSEDSCGLHSEQDEDCELELGRSFGTVENNRLAAADCSITLTSQRIRRRQRYSFGDGVSKWASELLQRCSNSARIRITPLSSTGVAMEAKEEEDVVLYAHSNRKTA